MGSRKVVRVVTNSAWFDIFSEVVVCTLVVSTSDYMPIVLDIEVRFKQSIS